MQKALRKRGFLRYNDHKGGSVCFDYDRIEFYDEETEEDRFDTIGDTSAGNALLTRQGVSSTMIGDISRFTDDYYQQSVYFP